MCKLAALDERQSNRSTVAYEAVRLAKCWLPFWERKFLRGLCLLQNLTERMLIYKPLAYWSENFINVYFQSSKEETDRNSWYGHFESAEPAEV